MLFSSILIRYTGAVITTAVSQLKDGLVMQAFKKSNLGPGLIGLGQNECEWMN